MAKVLEAGAALAERLAAARLGQAVGVDVEVSSGGTAAVEGSGLEGLEGSGLRMGENLDTGQSLHPKPPNSPSPIALTSKPTLCEICRGRQTSEQAYDRWSKLIPMCAECARFSRIAGCGPK